MFIRDSKGKERLSDLVTNNGRFKAVERNAANIRATERLLLITCGYLVIRNEKYWKYTEKENPVRVVLTIRQVYNILLY